MPLESPEATACTNSLSKGFDTFETGFSETDNVLIGFRTAGQGEGVLLIHGWPMTGFEWRYVSAELVSDYQVVIPDYRGAGASSVPTNGYDSLSMASDLIPLLEQLGLRSVHVVGHDIGAQTATALAIAHPNRVKSLTFIESVIPGMSAYDAFVASGNAWHFKFNALIELAADLTEGREGRYFQHFFSQFIGKPEAISQADRDYYTECYATRDRLIASYRIYEAFEQDADFFSQKLASDGISSPVMVVCGEASMAASLDMLSKDLGAQRTEVIESTGHFIPEESPKALVNVLKSFWKSL